MAGNIPGTKLLNDLSQPEVFFIKPGHNSYYAPVLSSFRFVKRFENSEKAKITFFKPKFISRREINYLTHFNSTHRVELKF